MPTLTLWKAHKDGKWWQVRAGRQVIAFDLTESDARRIVECVNAVALANLKG